MYIPPHFLEDRPAELQRVIRAHPLGVLVTHDADGALDADHLPFEFDPGAGAGAGTHGVLSAHVARANPLWRRCPTGPSRRRSPASPTAWSSGPPDRHRASSSVSSSSTIVQPAGLAEPPQI